MDKVFWAVVKTARPQRWVRNLSLFAALIFSGQLFEPVLFWRVAAAAAIFSLVSSTVYFFNDLIDAPLDRRHPFKMKRPIASGALSAPAAVFLATVGFFISLILALKLSYFFFVACLAYFILQAAYSLKLKHIEIIDLLVIATGFILRAYSGALVIDGHISVWFLLCVIAVSMLLAVGKRRAELSLLAEKASEVRATLGGYPEHLMDVWVGMFGTMTILSYILFTFQQQFDEPSRRLIPLLLFLPRALTVQKWLMITIPVVIYGVMRYLQLIYKKNQGEAPERVLLTDAPLLTSVIVWGFLAVAVLYVIG
ncbi:UbiA prenyltransferase family protein [Candidatus Collierbacteria bacterium]|nr:UbiA prenyltransferase family protein [Candidatus Collierbacteria bacterium]